MAKRTYGSMERMDTLMSSDSSPEMAESGSAAQCGAPLFGGDNTSLQGWVFLVFHSQIEYNTE